MPELRIISPDRDLLSSSIAQDERIEYFQTREKIGSSWTNIHEHFEFRMADPALSKNIKDFLYKEYMLNPLAETLSGMYPSQRPGVRGVTVTIYNPVKYSAELYVDELEIITLLNVLRSGTELQGENKTRLALLSGSSINKCVAECLRVVEVFREKAPEPKQDWIFPGILVYDLSKLKRDKSNEDEKNQWRLPSSEKERESVILNAYILDYLDVIEE